MNGTRQLVNHVRCMSFILRERQRGIVADEGHAVIEVTFDVALLPRYLVVWL